MVLSTEETTSLFEVSSGEMYVDKGNIDVCAILVLWNSLVELVPKPGSVWVPLEDSRLLA